jgi:hypothetical protein
MAKRWTRKAAENGHIDACFNLAAFMYADEPYAREVGFVVEAAGVALSARVMERHDVPAEVLTGVTHWLQKGGFDPEMALDGLRRSTLEGGKYCRNDGCEVVGQRKDFKVCPQCKTARYCATRVRNRTGRRVGTKRHVAHSKFTIDVQLYRKVCRFCSCSSGRRTQVVLYNFTCLRMLQAVLLPRPLQHVKVPAC